MIKIAHLVLWRAGRLTLLSIACFIAACGSVHGPISDIYNGYRKLDPPRSNFSVGAVWVPALNSTSGPGLPADSLNTGSTSNYMLASDDGLDVNFSISQYLGFGGGGTKTLNVNVTDAEIVTVDNLSDLPLGDSAKNFVYSAIRVNKFNINADSSIYSKLHNVLIERLNLSNGNITLSTNNNIEISGANLYIAFKTIEVSKPIAKIKRLSVNYDTEEKISLKGITLKAWSRFTYPCNEGPRVYWLVQSDQIMDGATSLRRSGYTALEKAPSQEYQSSKTKQLFDVSSDDIIDIYKGLDGNTVRRVQLRLAYDGMEVVDYLPGETLCHQVSKGSSQGVIELVVIEYDLKSN